MKTISALYCLFLLAAGNLNAQPPDKIIRVDTISVGDTICFADSIKSYVAEFYFPNGKNATVRGATNCIEPVSRAKSGTRISVKEIIAEDRTGKKVRLERRAYYVK